MPYNVIELFDSPYAFLTAVLLLAAGIGMATSSAVCAAWWRHSPRQFALWGGGGIMLVCLVTFCLIWLASPAESLDDILGTPLWWRDLQRSGAEENGSPIVADRWLSQATVDTVERGIRFTALAAAPIAACTLAAFLVFYGFTRRHIWGILPLAGLALFHYWIVVVCTRTDNVVELLRDDGSPLSVAIFLTWFAALGAAAAMLTRCWPSRLSPGSLVTYFFELALIVVISLAIGWGLLVAGSNPELHKYGRTFSARQFLLSPDRDHYLSDRHLIPRYALAHSVLLGLTAAGLAVGRSCAVKLQDSPDRIRA